LLSAEIPKSNGYFAHHFLQVWSSGKIMNIMSTDTNRLDMVCQFIHFSWSTPMQMAIATGLLIWQLQYAAVAGCAIVVASIPLQLWVGKRMKMLRNRVGTMSDHRYGK
jgi:ATP-binding cassette subfamily C (CFTR/MRP) protein 1